ncbi:MAG: hypothetical protein KatS3mg117_0162 [Geminicoccaceae bacterium]|nr:MAG: hypothetical protein KatS3mg117_0162 [Geminicoccaceae bacterium]
MNAVLFVGPSFPRLHDLDLPGIRVLPPAAQGDVLRAMDEGARLIGLVDGVFGHEPAVWHKEILAALEAGIAVLGAASMGALRAAELHPFGMEGVGTIFAAYRDGILLADDEVALLHGPAELGWPALSEPMVNLRATLARLARLGLLGEGEAACAAHRLAARFYPERTRAALEAVLAEIVGQRRADTVRRWARRLAVDVKRADAARLVRRLRARLADPAPPVCRFVASRSGPLRRLLAEHHAARTALGPTSSPATETLAGLPPQPMRPWTVLTFAAADNDLAPELRADLEELRAAPELAELHVAGELDSTEPGFRGRFAFLPGAPDDAEHRAPRLVIEPVGARNTGDPGLLRELLRWGIATFPGRRRALVLWGHGEGNRIAIDDGSADALTIAELLAAFEAGLASTGPLDLLVFDACLMAKLELLADLAPFARIVLASGEVVPASGLPYHRAVAVLARARDPGTAAAALISAFLDDAAARRQSHARQVAARTDRAGAAMEAVGRLGEVLATLPPDALRTIRAVRLLARTARAGALVDAVDLVERLSRALRDHRIEELARAAVAAIEACILHAEALWPRRGPMRGGLNLWFPTQSALFLAGRDDYAARPALRGPGSGWLRFLDRFHGCCASDEHHSGATRLRLETSVPP